VSQAIPNSVGTRSEPAERFYLPELDVLRFFAFFGVFVFHLPPTSVWFFWNYGALGYLGISGVFGVDLFFTLSGYLLTRLLLREREQTGDINVKAFYARRALRIWPLYYFVVLFVFLLSLLPASITSAPPFVVDPFASMQLHTYFFMAIFLFNFSFAYRNPTNGLPLMFNLWTISLEEQFYLFWPWVMRYVPRRRIVVIPIVMIVVAVIARAISLPLKVDTFVWNNTFTRLDPIAVGILIALMPRLNPRPALRVVLVILGFASWFFATYYCGLSLQVSTLKISVGYPAVAIGSGAFLLAMLGTKSFNPSSALARCLIYLGKISYGLYVYNPIARTLALVFLLRVVNRMVMAAGWAPWTAWLVYVLLAFGLNLALAAASYRWLEAPFLRLKERFARIPSRAV
jgi:peptidoglycan/LPS O-acetylase OafA/YrhL